MSSLTSRQEEVLGVLRDEWNIDPPSDWQSALTRMQDEWRAVEWQSGGTTLMSALGLQYLEVPLCRGLAWLLDPAGGHGMGRHFVDEFLASLKRSPATDAPITIHVEERREETRADIVLRVRPHTVVIEAKVYAGEQPGQADRLADRFADGDPVLVFLTRTGHLPSTADVSADRWVPKTWRDIAHLAQRVSDKYGLKPSAGAHEFIETIGALH
jgi:hypothetical protein